MGCLVNSHSTEEGPGWFILLLLLTTSEPISFLHNDKDSTEKPSTVGWSSALFCRTIVSVWPPRPQGRKARGPGFGQREEASLGFAGLDKSYQKQLHFDLEIDFQFQELTFKRSAKGSIGAVVCLGFFGDRAGRTNRTPSARVVLWQASVARLGAGFHRFNERSYACATRLRLRRSPLNDRSFSLLFPSQL
jgi:hypothetical protein